MCILAAAMTLLLASCSKKKEAAPAPSEMPKEVPFVQLYPAFGALLVAFPKDPTVSAADFHATAVLIGDSVPTTEVQRYPLGEIQALLVTGIIPQRFRIISQAFVQTGFPYAGGRLDSVRIDAGKITVLEASPAHGDHLPFHDTVLHFAKEVPWTYNQSQKLEDYLSGLIGKGKQG